MADIREGLLKRTTTDENIEKTLDMFLDDYQKVYEIQGCRHLSTNGLVLVKWLQTNEDFLLWVDHFTSETKQSVYYVLLNKLDVKNRETKSGLQKNKNFSSGQCTSLKNEEVGTSIDTKEHRFSLIMLGFPSREVTIGSTN